MTTLSEEPNVLLMIKAARSFESLSDVNKKYLAQHTLVKTYKKGEFLWKKQDPGEFCAFIIDGLVEIANVNKGGDELILGVFGPGDLIGLSAILKRTQYPANAVVASKSSKTLQLFVRSMDSDLKGENLLNMLNWQRERLLIHEQILRDKIMILGAGQLHRRLIELFDHLRMRFSKGHEIKSKNILIPVPLTKTLVAKIIEARVETVIRILNKWEKAGYLIINEKSVTLINFEKLRELDEVP